MSFLEEGRGRGVQVSWSLDRPFGYMVELWSVEATVEAILKALASGNEGFLEKAGRILQTQKVLEEEDQGVPDDRRQQVTRRHGDDERDLRGDPDP